MGTSRLTYLFQVFFSKKATPKEREELMQLMVKTENDEQIKALLEEAWKKFDSNNQIFNAEQFETMLSNIVGQGAVNRPVHHMVKDRRPFKWLRMVAAAAAIFFLVGTGVLLWLRYKDDKPPIAQSEKTFNNHRNAIEPGRNKAVLTLSDGSSIILDSAHQGVLVKQGHVNVISLNTATVAYQSDKDKDEAVVYNTLSTPRGGQYQLRLSDNTMVWLNASSSIYFPTRFKGKERAVTVTGEVYFEVAKNAAMPFKVTVKDVQVQVLGTHFNIMAYDNEGSINTTLLEGAVKVSKGALNKTLIPGQESRINNTDAIKVVEADIEEVMAWKNGWFQFNGYDIEKVMRQISRWYDVEVVYEGKIPTGHFSGMVSRQNDISQVLKILQAGGVRFKIEGRKVVVLS